MAKAIKVKKWILKGEFSGDEKNSGDIIDVAANAMDGAGTHEILGSNLFLGKDGKYYTVTVEAVIGLASKEHVKDTLADVKAEADLEDCPNA